MSGITGGDFKRTLARLDAYQHIDFLSAVNRAGRVGLNRLSSATPKDTGKAAHSWDYRIETISRTRYKLIWTNDDKISTGIPLVLLIEYGHGVKGGYVPAVNFIDSALAPVYRDFSDSIEEALRI